MALHIQMSEEAERELRRTAMRNRLSSIGACLAFLLLGGCMLYFTVLYIAGQEPVAFLTYTPPADDAAPTNQPVAQQMSAKSSPSSAEVTPEIIVAQGTSSMVMAPVTLDTADGVDISPSVDLGMGMGMGDLGDGLGDGGGGLGSGSAGGSALEGTFYDLKQTRSGAKTKVTFDPKTQHLTGNGNKEVIGIVKEFLDKNWQNSTLSKYFQSRTKLYASTFYMPQLAATYSPYAYQCSDKVKACAVVAVYRGKVRAPKTGKFRFVGGGDEILAVRFNRKTVLEWGYEVVTAGFSGNRGRYKGNEFQTHYEKMKKLGYGNVIRYKRDDNPKDPAPKGNESRFQPFFDEVGIAQGITFDVKEGETYPIEILISEFGGGAFGFYLFIEEVGSNMPKTKSGQPIFQIFRTNFNNPDQKAIKKMVGDDGKKAGGSFFWRGNGEMYGPPYDEDSLIWTAVP